MSEAGRNRWFMGWPPAPEVPPMPPMPGKIEYLSAPPIWNDPFLVEYERQLLKAAALACNPLIVVDPRAVNIHQGGEDMGEGTKSATEKLDEVKSTVANLEGQVERLTTANKELQGRVKSQTEFVHDRALYVNQDGSVRNTGVYLEPFDGGARIARTVYFSEIARMELRDMGRANYWPPMPTKRTYRLQFSQAKLHVYQEV